MNDRNPYATNGYVNTHATNTNVSGRYGDVYAQNNNPSNHSINSYSSHERRAGGWGGFRDAPSSQPEETSPQPPSGRSQYGDSDSSDWRRRPGTGNRQYEETSRSMDRGAKARPLNGVRTHSPRRGGKSVEEILHYIQSEWSFMGGDECVPVQVALKLMDPSSLGLGDREPQFQQTHVDLQRALKSIVNEHHQDFNSSIGTYHKIQSSIQSSQSRVRYLKSALGDARSGLLTTKPELKGLATSSQTFDDNLQLFNQIQSVQSVPERLEGQISEKRFLTAVDILQDALRLIRKSDFDGIGAIGDLRTYFSNQEQSLTDILIEELHDHLYLKSPYCQDRWKTKSANGEERAPDAATRLNGVNPWDKPVYHYLSRLDVSAPMAEDTSRNPEADTFYYIHTIVESLNRLGHMDTAIARIEQRLPIELFRVVEKTNIEVDARYPGQVRRQTNKERRRSQLLQTNDGRGDVLSDFLWSLYAKFEAIAEGHRVLHEVVSGIVDREKLPQSETYIGGFKELWKIYQSEIRSLLHDYLATNGDMSLRSGLSNADSGNVFARNLRDKNKRMFKLSEMDQRSSEMKKEQENLDEILKASVPGLVSKTRARTGLVSDSGRSGSDSTSAGHKLLIEPSVFNITILLPPSLSFLQRLKDIVPVSSDIAMSTLTSFLDDFLVNIFHPQLEEAITDLCTECIIDLEAFTEEPQWSRYAPRPIFRGTIVFMSLIRAFSGMLGAIPQDQIFIQLIITQLVSYYDKCHGWFKAVVSRLTPNPSNSSLNVLSMKAAAAYAESGEVHDVTADLWKADNNPAAALDLINKEIQLIISATKAKPLSAYDIISDPKSVASLSLLYNSLQWLSSSLLQLRHIDSSSTSSNPRSRPSSQSQPRRWTLIAALKPIHTRSKSEGAVGIPVHLPMTAESVIPFDKTVSSFRGLAQTALLTLHIDIRLGVFHQLTRSLRGPNAVPLDQFPSPPPRDSSALPATDSGLYHWVLSQPPTSASPLVLDLNADLITFDSNISTYLGRKERTFVTTGLAKLVDRVLVVGADYIQVVNSYGAQRIGLDILVLQQNLRNIAISADPSPPPVGVLDSKFVSTEGDANSAPSGDQEAILKDSAQFYDLFLQGPERVMAFVKMHKGKDGGVGYSYDELRALIELCYSAGLRSKDREENIKTKKSLQDDLLQLGELLWDS